MHRLRIRRRSDWLLGLLDALSAAGVDLFAYRLRFDGEVVPRRYVHRYEVAAVVLAVLWPVAGRIGGLYARRALRPGTSLVEAAFGTALGAGAVLLALNVLGLDGDLSRAWLGLVVLGLMVSALLVRGFVRRARRALVPLGIGLERYAVVGDGLAARRLHDDLTRAPGAPFEVVATAVGRTSEASELVRQARTLRVDGLVLPGDVGPEQRAGATSRASLAASGVDVLLAPGVGGLETRVASVAMLHGVPLLRAAGLTPRRRAVRGRRQSGGSFSAARRGDPGHARGAGVLRRFRDLRRAAGPAPGRCEAITTTVYCRPAHAFLAGRARGAGSGWSPCRRSARKYLDTVVHTFGLSRCHLVLADALTRDVVLCNAANAPVVAFLRLCRVPGAAQRRRPRVAAYEVGGRSAGPGTGWGSGSPSGWPACW